MRMRAFQTKLVGQKPTPPFSGHYFWCPVCQAEREFVAIGPKFDQYFYCTVCTTREADANKRLYRIESAKAMPLMAPEDYAT